MPFTKKLKSAIYNVGYKLQSCSTYFQQNIGRMTYSWVNHVDEIYFDEGAIRREFNALCIMDDSLEKLRQEALASEMRKEEARLQSCGTQSRFQQLPRLNVDMRQQVTQQTLARLCEEARQQQNVGFDDEVRRGIAFTRQMTGLRYEDPTEARLREEPMYQDTAKQQRIARLKQEVAMLLNKNY